MNRILLIVILSLFTTKSFSQVQIENINDELAFLGPVKASAVLEAQQRIVNIIRKLDEEGKVLISGRGGEDEIIS